MNGFPQRDAERGRALVVIPVYGHDEMTHDVLRDLDRERDLADVVVVDNRGDYQPLGAEDVLRPGSNLGWAGGTNLGTVERRRSDHVGFVWLNNDTRLSRGFVAGLLRAWRATGGGLLAPAYDCFWIHQRAPETPPVDDYRPRPIHFRAPFVDGTCMFVPATTVDAIGLLDAETFAPIGWGADLDYALRARAARLDVVVTRLSYLHHEKSVTGKTVFDGIEGYAAEGDPVFKRGLSAKWGDDWRRLTRIDATTGNTKPLGWRARLRRRPVRDLVARTQ
jgi:GT2 family glycosyltransferase